MPGLDVIAELDSDADRTSYQARRDGVEYTLTVFGSDLDRAGSLKRFYREAALLSAIGDPRLPAVHEVGEVGGRPYLVTDLVTGRPLADRIAGDPLSVSEAMRLILDVVEPLAAMHRQGLVHRDLSPRKLIILDDGSARLVDAGIGGDQSDGHPGRRAGLGYLAPEQSGTLARPVDNRTDLYALGVVLFECLTGALPLPADQASAATDPRTLVGDLPESLALLVTTLLAREPGERYQSGEELAADLRLLLGLDLGDTPKLLGRERELDLVNGVWDQVRQGQGRGITVRGVAGVGRTSLTDEILRRARQTGAPVLALSCLPDNSEPMAPLRRAVESLLQDADALPVASRRALHAQVRAAAGTAAPLLAELSPALGDLLGITPLPVADRRDQFPAAVGRFIIDLARGSGGLVLATDDADLIDPSTLRVMSYVAPRMADVPLLSLSSFRSDRDPAFRLDPLVPAGWAANDLDLVLEPLERPGMDRLLCSRLPGIDLDSGLARALREHGGGNPFVLLEHLRLVIDAGLVRPHWGAWLLDEGARDLLRLPDNPLGLVRSGLATLDPVARRVLLVAAVTGIRFRPADLAQIGGLEPEETFTALANAAGRGFVELAGEGDYVFRSERIREALLDGIDPGESAQLHQCAAEVLGRRLDGLDESGSSGAADLYAIAQHYLLGAASATDNQASDNRAFEVCRAAGLLAMRAHAPDQAVTFLDHAAGLRPPDARLLYILGTALHWDRQYPAARQHLEEALLAERDGLRRARILLRLTQVHRATRNTQQAVTRIEWGLAELDAALPDGRLLRALGAIRAGLVAFFISVTGWGFGTAHSRERERQRLLAALHLVGGQLADANLWSANQLMHRLYGARAAARLGAGVEYSLNCAAVGLTAARYGFGWLRRRSLALAEQAAADLGDPQLVAQIAWHAGAADYLGRVDNGERWIQCLTDHAQWLDTEQFGETITAVCWDAAVQGRNDDVLSWAEQGQRIIGGGTELTALLTVPAIGLTAASRPVAANAELRALRAKLEGCGGRNLKVNLVLAELYALLEQDHLGEHFDGVAERFFDFKLSTTGMLRQHQSFYVMYARGRLAQCRTEPLLLETRLSAARIAVRQLRSVAHTPLLKAAYRQSRAELQVLEGNPRQALRLLSRLKPLREDAPLLHFEIARTTARALLAAGYPADAWRQILDALNLAIEHGWSSRGSRLTTEFGLPRPSSE